MFLKKKFRVVTRDGLFRIQEGWLVWFIPVYYRFLKDSHDLPYEVDNLYDAVYKFRKVVKANREGRWHPVNVEKVR